MLNFLLTLLESHYSIFIENPLILFAAVWFWSLIVALMIAAFYSGKGTKPKAYHDGFARRLPKRV